MIMIKTKFKDGAEMQLVEQQFEVIVSIHIDIKQVIPLTAPLKMRIYSSYFGCVHWNTSDLRIKICSRAV
jgi:hypothetical protein